MNILMINFNNNKSFFTCILPTLKFSFILISPVLIKFCSFFEVVEESKIFNTCEAMQKNLNVGGYMQLRCCLPEN